MTQAHNEDEVTWYKTREEFHNAAIDAKESFNRGSSQSSNNNGKLEEIMWYFDFQKPAEEVELGEVSIASSYVALDYWNKEDDQLGSILIQTWREGIGGTEYNAETKYLDMLKSRMGGSDIQINGKRVIKRDLLGYTIYV